MARDSRERAGFTNAIFKLNEGRGSIYRGVLSQTFSCVTCRGRRPSLLVASVGCCSHILWYIHHILTGGMLVLGIRSTEPLRCFYVESLVVDGGSRHILIPLLQGFDTGSRSLKGPVASSAVGAYHPSAEPYVSPVDAAVVG